MARAKDVSRTQGRRVQSTLANDLLALGAHFDVGLHGGLEVALLFLTMGMLGMGNGAVFQLVPQRFSERIGVLTGLVGAAGGVGGFFLPFLLGTIKQRTGQYSGGLFLFGAAFFLAALILLQLGTRWRASWQEAAIERAGIFSYRNFAGSPASEPAK